MSKDRLKEIEESYSNAVDIALSDNETLAEYEIEIADLNYLIEQARMVKDLKRVIARNLVAWDTSKDKREGLLPEVYLTNKYWYKRLTAEQYRQHEAEKKFYIGD